LQVHLRYEDDISFADRAFACGCTIESLEARTPTHLLTPGFADPPRLVILKHIYLRNLSI
jgi:hypothetical protein